MARKPKCAICGLKPSNGNGYCHNCNAKIEKANRLKAKRNGKGKIERYLTYQGHVVGLFREGKQVLGKLLMLEPEKLPKAKTMNLNSWIVGANREEVKRLKAKVLKLANAMEN